MSFRREARTPKGGPDGGNGGRGGSVFVVADPTVEDLSHYKHVVHHKARPGQAGSGRRRHGKAGEDVDLAVPVGTRVIRDGAVIATLDEAGERAEVARGGDGGIGNFAFRSSTHQTPRESVPGTAGDETWLTLELRLAIDVAIVGLPNSGKSALLRALTGAPAVVAPYPRSTKHPMFGPLTDDYGALLLVVDLPGVDEQGDPRRDGHLEQLERARVVLHCVDASTDVSIPERLARVRRTLARFVADTANELVIATHADPDDPPPGVDHAVDSASAAGVDALRARLIAILTGG